MNPLPHSDRPLVLRTTFGDEDAWRALQEAIHQPVDGFQAQVTCLSRVEDAGISSVDLLAAGAGTCGQAIVVLADAIAFQPPEHPLLVVDLIDQPGRTFRCPVAALWSVENNLSLGNMDFSDFLAATGPDGIFRGFEALPAD